VITEVHTGVTRVGEEVEVEMMTDATHVVLEIVHWMTLAEMAISIEAVDAIARDQDLPTGIIDHEVIDVNEMSVTIGMIGKAVSHEIRVGHERRSAAKAEAPSQRKRVLHL
jgi:hypothetical protein